MPDQPTEKRADKSVPLVIYKGGERHVIGSAYLKGDGSIEGQITKDVKKELKDLIFGDRIGDLSLNPKVPRPVIVNYPPEPEPIRFVGVVPPEVQER